MQNPTKIVTRLNGVHLKKYQCRYVWLKQVLHASSATHVPEVDNSNYIHST